MAWFLGNNKKKYLEKLKKANQEREEKASIKAIGDISPEQKEQRARKVEIAKEEKKLEEAREKRKEEDKATEDQLLIVNGAKIKMGPHMGSFKVLSDVPTTQGKLTGTVVEKSPANFTFNDGFQLLSLTEWQDVGTIKYQDNKVLIKKSKIIATGKMPSNTPPETAPIEFIDSGQINVVESIDTDGIPVPSYEEKKSVENIIWKDKSGNDINNTIHYGEYVCLEIETKGMIGDTIKIIIKSSKNDEIIDEFDVLLEKDKVTTAPFIISIDSYDESLENYDYNKHLTNGYFPSYHAEVKDFYSETKGIKPITYCRNYEEFIGLFKFGENGAKDSEDNYENHFINKNLKIKALVDDFKEFIKDQNLNYDEIKPRVEKDSTQLWNLAVKQVQNGELDDRPLYWARNKMQTWLKRHPVFKSNIDFDKSIVKKGTDLAKIIKIFEEKSRNYKGINFSKFDKRKNVLVTGFDPFMLNSIKHEYQQHYNIEQSNPSGIVALALANNDELGAYIQTMIIPVRYTDFDGSEDYEIGQGEGIIEEYIKPLIEKEEKKVDMIITVSQAGPKKYNIDVFATATRGGFNDNMDFVREKESKSVGDNAPETIVTTLPQSFVESDSKAIFYGKYTDEDGTIKYADTSNFPTGKVPYGPGGDYLSNEIFYRVAKIRNEIKPKLKTGHFHISKIQGVGDDLDPQEAKKLLDIVKQTLREGFKGI